MAAPEKEFEEFKANAFKFMWEELAPLEDEIERTGRILLRVPLVSQVKTI